MQACKSSGALKYDKRVRSPAERGDRGVTRAWLSGKCNNCVEHVNYKGQESYNNNQNERGEVSIYWDKLCNKYSFNL